MKNQKFIFAILIFIASIFTSCKFFATIQGSEDNLIEITSLSLGKSTLTMKVGAMDYVQLL